MKNRIFMILTMVLLLWSCNDESLDLQNKDVDSNATNTSSEKLRDDDFVCSTIMPTKADSISTRVSYKGTYWQRGQTIRIKFLNGSSYMQSLVRNYANEWTYYANLRFEWVGRYDYADIKIQFDYNGKGGQSAVGVWSKYYGQDSPSMWFHSLDYYSNAGKRRVVLHEFGHALGLGHEHQNPTANISWNYQNVYNYYYRAGWTKQMVDDNIFRKFDRNSVDYGFFDGNSIMNYSIPWYFTTNGVSYSQNYNLSLVDMHSIGMIYPFSQDGSNRVSLYRYYSGAANDHFYTNNWGELGWDRYSYRFEQWVGYLDDSPSWDNVPMYRYYSYWTSDHLYTSNFDEIADTKYGYVFEGVIGYLKRNQVPGSVPLYRYWHPGGQDHLYTKDFNELGWGKWGWYYEGVIGYIMQQ